MKVTNLDFKNYLEENSLENFIDNSKVSFYDDYFRKIIDNNFLKEEISEFLIKLNEENLPLEAFLSAVQTLRSCMNEIALDEEILKNSIDVCGTGGDKLNSLNISTTVSFILASFDVNVFKHGNKAVSSLSGSADIFSKFGTKLVQNKKEIIEEIKKNNLVFLFAPFFHPALKNVAEIRKSLKTPTIFNYLGPLLNPANVRYQIIGTSRHDTMEKMAKIIALDKNKKAFIVHGFDGMDEITITNKTYLLKVKNGKVYPTQEIDPNDYGFQLAKIEDIKGGDSDYNLQRMIELFKGKIDPYYDISVLNAAFALFLLGKFDSVKEAIKQIKGKLLDGSVYKKFVNLK